MLFYWARKGGGLLIGKHYLLFANLEILEDIFVVLRH